jgi:hypothetical protein
MAWDSVISYTIGNIVVYEDRNGIYLSIGVVSSLAINNLKKYLKHFWRAEIVLVTYVIEASAPNIVSICLSELAIDRICSTVSLRIFHEANTV